MSKLYVFGDSWTECRNTQNWHPYVKTYNGKLGKSWPNLLAEKLGLELYNFGRSGCSFEYIINRLIAAMDTIENDSTVIVGGTSATRIFFPYFTSIEEGFSLPIGKHPESYDGKELREMLGLSEKQNNDMRNAAIDYAVNIRLPFDYHFNRYYYNSLYRLLNSLKKTKGIRFLLWNWEEMRTRNIERMLEDKNSGFYKSGNKGGSHPSFNGYITMYETFLSYLEKSKETVGFTKNFVADSDYFINSYA